MATLVIVSSGVTLWPRAQETPQGPYLFTPPVLEDGNILINPHVDVLRRDNQRWSFTLVDYFLHSTLPYKVVEPLERRL